MNKRNLIFDNLRGISMLGVIGIHIGSMGMEYANCSPFWFLIFSVLSRYSVPCFFFISGFGLFLTHPLEQSLNYGRFVVKRLRSIGIPYLIWTFFYMYINNRTYYDANVWSWDNISFCVMFGNGSYHIYFLVILLWFYLLFPLWRRLMTCLEKFDLKLTLPLLALAQLYFYDASAHYWSYPAWIQDNEFIFNLFQFRLNYLPLYYLFIFMLGGVISRHYAGFEQLLKRHFLLLLTCFLLSAGINTYLFYDMYANLKVNPEVIANTLQQLSLPGFFYTITALLFGCGVLYRFKDKRLGWLEKFSDHSFVIYLIHPLFMDQLYFGLMLMGISFTQVPIYIFYLVVLACSYSCAAIWSIAKKSLTSK